MADDISERLVRAAREWGATGLRIERGGKHPRLIGHYDGFAFMFVFPGSTGDRRAVLNCLSDLRRVMGVEREVKPERSPTKSQVRRVKRTVRSTSPAVEPVRREDRYYAPLAQIRDSMVASGPKARAEEDRPTPLRTPFLGRRRRFLKA
jgi:hypothetical protein